MSTRKLTYTEESAFASQMHVILHSDIPAMEGVSMMAEEAEGSDRELLNELKEAYEELRDLSKAMEKTGAFDDYMIRMCAIGEETGRLDEVTQSLASHYQREADVQTSVRSAVIYPLIMTGMMAVVIIILLVKVMPVFNSVFAQFGTQMSGIAAGLASVGNWLRAYGLSVLLVIAIILLALLAAQLSPAAREKTSKLFRSADKSSQDIAACRFASVMSLALRSGLTPDRGLELAESTIEDKDFLTKVQALAKDVADGEDLSEGFTKHNIFSSIYARMAGIGSRTGSLDTVLEQIADLYQTQIDDNLAHRLAVVEPVLIIILSVMVGVILLSVMFPLLSVMSTM